MENRSVIERLKELRDTHVISGVRLPGASRSVKPGMRIPHDTDTFGADRIVGKFHMLAENCLTIEYENGETEVLLNCPLAIMFSPKPEPVEEPESDPEPAEPEVPVDATGL